jgi:chaperonin GroES
MANVAYADDTAEPYGEEAQGEQRPSFDLMQAIDAPNIADMLPDDVLAQIGERVAEEFEIDVQSRKDEGWEERHERALKLAMQVKEEKSYPFPGLERQVPADHHGGDPVQRQGLSGDRGLGGDRQGQGARRALDQKRERADRIARFMSWQLLEEETEWEADTDKLLCILPVTGTVFRKRYFDPIKQRTCSEIITADKYVVNYWAQGTARGERTS